LTVQAFPASTKDNDQFELLEPPNPFWAEDTGGDDQKIQDATRNEAADFWNGNAATGGPYVEVVYASAASTVDHPLVQNFSTNGDLSTATALTGSTDIGALFDVWWHPEPIGDPFLKLDMPPIEKASVTGSVGQQAHVQGVREGSGTVELAFRGPGLSRIGDPAEAHTVLRCVFDVTAGTDSTIGAGSSGTSVIYSAGNHSVNDIAVTEGGDAFVITADTGGDTYTVSPAPRSNPTNGETLHGIQTYKPSDDLNYALTIQQWRGKGILEHAYGCVPKPTFAGERGQFLTISSEMLVSDWTRVHKDDSGELTRAWRRRLNLDGTDYDFVKFSFDPGYETPMRPNQMAPNYTDGYSLIDYKPTGAVTILVDTTNIEVIEKFIGGTQMTMLYQSGSNPGYPGIFAFWAYKVQYNGTEIGDLEGQISVELPFKVITDPTESTLKSFLLGIG
jgi:hypothetical protein